MKLYLATINNRTIKPLRTWRFKNAAFKKMSIALFTRPRLVRLIIIIIKNNHNKQQLRTVLHEVVND